MLNHYVPGGGLFTRVYEGQWADAGTVASLVRAAVVAEADAQAGTLTPPPVAPATPMTDDLAPDAHLLVTGGAGFIGSELVRQVLARRDGARVTVLDKLTYAGNRANLAAVEEDPEQAARFAFVQGDIADPEVVGPLVERADAVVNVAAETHVDRSILDPEAFLRTGVIGVHVLLEAVRRETERARTGDRPRAPRFLQVSTDEVYGEIADGRSVETDALEPRSPYAAAKAASELLVRAYHVTYGLDVVAHPRLEHLRPVPASREADPAVRHERPGRRAAADVRRRDADPRLAVRRRPRRGHRVRAPPRRRRARRTTWPARTSGRTARSSASCSTATGRDWSLVRSVPDRPGHDRRYAMDGSKAAALGWRAQVAFEQGLPETVAWYRDHADWVAAARSGDWDAYYERQYGDRLAAGQAVSEAG